MFLLRGLLDRILLIGAIFAAACVPSFIAQYRQRLGGRLDQVLHDLAPFQEIANRNHGGDLRKLVLSPSRCPADALARGAGELGGSSARRGHQVGQRAGQALRWPSRTQKTAPISSP